LHFENKIKSVSNVPFPCDPIQSRVEPFSLPHPENGWRRQEPLLLVRVSLAETVEVEAGGKEAAVADKFLVLKKGFESSQSNDRYHWIPNCEYSKAKVQFVNSYLKVQERFIRFIIRWTDPT
jgi:hypothetical protein